MKTSQARFVVVATLFFVGLAILGTRAFLYKSNPVDKKPSSSQEIATTTASATNLNKPVVFRSANQPSVPKDRIEILYPIGGEQFIEGDSYEIRWANYQGVEDLTIALQPVSGSTKIIARNVPATKNYYPWTVGAETLGSYRIQVYPAGGRELVGYSKNFLIVKGSKCVRSGCGNQFCTEEGNESVTTCEYRADYACYITANCGHQADGSCGWAQTDELKGCLASPPPIQ
jgi:hypothetical protein